MKVRKEEKKQRNSNKKRSSKRKSDQGIGKCNKKDGFRWTTEIQDRKEWQGETKSRSVGTDGSGKTVNKKKRTGGDSLLIFSPGRVPVRVRKVPSDN
jgi:hypothetical protein